MMKLMNLSNKTLFSVGVRQNLCRSLYTQGQRVDKKIREYFYFIDHEGMVILNLNYHKYLDSNFLVLQLFLDDARIKNFTSCFKEKRFLRFFFKRLRFNTTDRYQNEFPYISLCGVERNYVRCDDLPIVFTDVIANDAGGFSSRNIQFHNKSN